MSHSLDASMDLEVDFDIQSVVPTEQVNPDTLSIDLATTQQALQLINDQDALVAAAVRQAIPAIAPVVDRVIEAFKNNGRLFYVGAGTSGRLGVLDASECPPTYSVPSDMVQGIIAGGDVALKQAVENAEDRAEEGAQAIRDYGVQAKDVVIGLSASGGAAYVTTALETAKKLGCFTAAVTCVADSPLANVADVPIVVSVGPEVITGSTRMKAGTAQKLVCNMITTTAMIGSGKTYRNLMVDLNPTNAKLRDRAFRLVSAISGVDAEKAKSLLEAAGGQVKPAVVMAKFDLSFDEAQAQLKAHDGRLRAVLEQLAPAEGEL